MMRVVYCVAISLSLLTGQASARETKTYRYDALARMTGITRDGAGAAGHFSYMFDAADNRVALNVESVALRTVVYDLRPGEMLIPRQQLAASDGRSKLILHDDGSLRLYDPGTAPLWSAISSTPDTRLILQNDCTLMIYNGSTALWSTATQC